MTGKLIPDEFPCPVHDSPARITAYRGGEYEVVCGWGGHELSTTQMARAAESWPDAPLPPLDALRAEVERLMIDAAAREASATQTGSALRASGRAAAYGTVLDLIDKHAREGQ